MRDSVAEIRRSRPLQMYGACLSLTLGLSALYWRRSPRYVADPGDAICWPFFEDCVVARVFSAPLLECYLALLAALSVVATLVFLHGRHHRAAWLLLAGTTMVKAFYMVQDYRLMGNYHYMPFVLVTAYLFIPDKKRLLPVLLVAFYLSAGALKVNREWLSGAALIREAAVSGKLLEICAAYVVLLELVFVLGLLSKSQRIRWLLLVQLAAFHAFSYHLVGWFYPATMSFLLAIFPLLWLSKERADAPLAFFCTGRAPAAASSFLGLYVLAQLAPSLFPGDAALNGEGRLVALNMFDARAVCDEATFVKRGSFTEERNAGHPELALRIHCDPIVYWNAARALCRTPGGTDRVDTFLVARRTSDSTYTSVLSVTDFCAKDPAYEVWAPNRWLSGP